MGLRDQYNQRYETAVAAAEKKLTAEQNQKNTERPNGQIEAALRAQPNRTEVFVNSFSALSGELNDLRTKVATEALEKELGNLEAESASTRKALDPPKAKLAFSFLPFPFEPGKSFRPATGIGVTPDAEGNVQLRLTIVNNTETTALDGEFILEICRDCKFAKEPIGFVKHPGSLDTVRNFIFQRILPMIKVHELVVSVTPPTGYASFAVSTRYRCRNCIVEEQVVGSVSVQRDFPLIPPKAAKEKKELRMKLTNAERPILGTEGVERD